MISIFKNKIYRRGFIKQVCVLLIIALLIVALIFSQMIRIYIENFEETTTEIQKQNNIEIKNSVERIEFFISRIYSDQVLLKDFLRYFNKDVEEYLSAKLDEQDITNRNIDFINECKLFIKETNYCVKEIIFRSDYYYNVIKFSENKNCEFDFSIPLSEMKVPANNIKFGITYSKPLPQPNDVSKNLGEIIFILQPEKILKKPQQTAAINMYAINEGGSICINDSNELLSQDIINQISNTGLNKGWLFNDNATIYFSNISTQNNYQLVNYITINSIIKQNRNAFLLLILLSIFLFLTILLILYIKQKNNISFIQNIISSIDDAKAGKFSYRKFEHRTDEYGLIADKLNDMSIQINSFIDKEYILKISQQDAEMKALQNQINPHFLYNTLEIIRSKALVNDDAEVSEAVSHLGNLYRNIVKVENVITIKKELEILEEYIKLMEFKYSDKLCCQIDFDEETLNLETVKLWMQPIVENFIKYGLDLESEYNLLIIIGKSFKEYYQIKFIDNGVNLSDEKINEINQRFIKSYEIRVKESSGLENIFYRLSKFYNSKIQMWIENNETAGITTVLKIYK